jgi:two-component system NtrC family sensor kinase
MVLLEYFKIIPHYSLKKFLPENIYLNIYYISGSVFVFTSTMYLSVYMATSITRRLRKRQREIISLKEELEEKNRQLEETQSTLIQSEKMSALGQFSAGVAHEIKNPLTGVLTYIKLMLKNITENKINIQEFKERLSIMEQETERCVRIIRNLLDFARQSEFSFKETDINSLIEDSLSFIQHHAELEKVKIIKELNPALPKVNVDPHQIQQVFVNIILNAIQAMPDGGTLTIKTGIDKELVYIKFTDTGVGISKENMKKLFTPFFTTKEKGSGLGLAVCYGIIEKHKGRIEVESEEGKGTTFTIKLRINKDGEV